MNEHLDPILYDVFDFDLSASDSELYVFGPRGVADVGLLTAVQPDGISLPCLIKH